MRIYKYPLDTVVHLPATSKVLCVQTQNNEPFLWVTCEPDKEPAVPWSFQIVPTGVDLFDLFHNYVGTFQMNDNRLVFHVFTNKGMWK